jgi:crossover junction endodeoxyribonuclease RuvC
MIIFGIDPGFSGAWGAIDETGAYVDCGDMLHTGTFLHFNQILKAMSQLVKNDECMAVVEAVHAMPKQGVSSSFKFGVSYGVALSLAQSLGTWSLATPRVWKQDLELTSDKNKSLDLARSLWPEAPISPQEGQWTRRGFADGRMEAQAVIARLLDVSLLYRQ